MKLALINDIHIGKPLTRNERVRASSHLIQERLLTILKRIETLHQPDLIVNLGDLIRGEEREINLFRYRAALHPFSQLSSPILHLIGNHELKYMTLEEIEKIWHEEGIEQKSYGLRTLGPLSIIWLGIDSKKYQHRLPEEQLDWLDKTLSQLKSPAIILSHCALDDHDVSGNYFYEGFSPKSTKGFFLENQEGVQQLIAKHSCVQLVVQAHLHYFHSKRIGNTPYVTCPAMGDNICGPEMENNVPEIYTILNYSEKHFSLKAYSREYCFAGAEFRHPRLGI